MYQFKLNVTPGVSSECMISDVHPRKNTPRGILKLLFFFSPLVK